jgi:predicted acetyltransferase
MDAVTIESIRPGDAEQRHRLSRQAFGAIDPFDPDLPALEPEKVVCAYDGPRMLGVVVTLDFAMTWGGAAVRCGGVSGVVVSPEARGRGLARRLLAESMDRMADRGQAVSALYPTTAELYRSVGFEVVGWFARRRVPLGQIPTEPADGLDWRRTDLDDPVLFDIERRMATRHDGWFRPDPVWIDRHLHQWRKDAKTNRFAYVGHRRGQDVTALIYRYASSDDSMYELDVELLAGTDGDAVAAGLAFLAAHGTTAGEVRTSIPAVVLALHVPHVQRTTVVSDWPWMLRLVDPPAAVAARGWPSAVEGTVELDIVDGFRPMNGGPHVLSVGGGAAELARGGSGRITARVEDLAGVYAGADVRALHGAGRLDGATGHDLDVLAAACVSTPTLPRFF